MYYLTRAPPVRHTHRVVGECNTIHGGVRQIIKLDLQSVSHEVDPETIDRLPAKGSPIFLWTLNARKASGTHALRAPRLMPLQPFPG